MTINLRADAPAQVTQTEPEKLSQQIKTLQDIQQEIDNHKNKIKELEEQKKEIQSTILTDLEANDANQMKEEFGTFSLVERKVYVYSPSYKTLEEETKVKIKEVEQPLKILKKLEEENDIAEVDTVKGLRFLAKQ